MITTISPAFEFTYDGCISSIYHADIGEGLPKHDHKYTHAIYVAAGKIVIRKYGLEKIADKYTQPINLKAGEWHEIEAIEDGTVFINVFSEEKQNLINPVAHIGGSQ